ncbi:Transcription antitermination protein RfaH [bacterium HR36]|nr:Transcription antitermination protein RfaH [bacterium HR36]
MPILAKEPACYPADLFQTAVPSAQDRWWVFYTRPRSEKTIARHLRAKNISYFLPLYKKYSKPRDRVLVSWNPVFPSYIFVFGSREARLAAIKTNLTVHEIIVHDQDEFHQDLANIYVVQESHLPYYPEHKLQPGANVTVTAGPLMGLSGRVSSWLSPLRLIVEVRLLQRAVCVELEPWMVSLS